MLDPPYSTFSGLDPFTSALFPPISTTTSTSMSSSNQSPPALGGAGETDSLVSLLGASLNFNRPTNLFGNQSLPLDGSSDGFEWPHSAPVTALHSLSHHQHQPAPFNPSDALSDELISSFLALTSASGPNVKVNVSQLAQLQMAALAQRYSALGAQAPLNQQSRRPSIPYSSSSALPSPVGAAAPVCRGTRSGSTSSQTSVFPHSPKNPKLYKTELCRSWMDSGRCNYGERCQYAHGTHEKREIPRHPKYKTEQCQSFHQTGYCPYGARCHFIHSDAERAAADMQRAQQAAAAALTMSGLASPLGAQSSPTAPRQQIVNMPQQQHSLSSLLSASPPTAAGMLSGVGGAMSAPHRHPASAYGGSTGESPGSTTDGSGSNSPTLSFSPALDVDDIPLRTIFDGVASGMPLSAPRAPRLPVFAQLSNPQ